MLSGLSVQTGRILTGPHGLSRFFEFKVGGRITPNLDRFHILALALGTGRTGICHPLTTAR